MSEDIPAVVGFVGQSGLWWLRPLRPGFRHCFVAVRHDPVWVVIDPLSHHTLTRVEAIIDLAGFYRQRGITVVTTCCRQPPRRPAPWRPCTCVETVKRILGIQTGWIVTPWQLYRHLVAGEYNP